MLQCLEIRDQVDPVYRTVDNQGSYLTAWITCWSGFAYSDDHSQNYFRCSQGRHEDYIGVSWWLNLDPQTGCFVKCHLCLERVHVPVLDLSVAPLPQAGTPVFDLAPWSGAKHEIKNMLEDKARVVVGWTSPGTLSAVRYDRASSPLIALCLQPDLSFLLDQDQRLAGIQFHNLSRMDKHVIGQVDPAVNVGRYVNP